MNTSLLPALLRRVALREWCAILGAMLLLALVLGWQNGLGRLDQTLYDMFVSSNDRPARDDIIIVAIDDYSLTQLGKWPWRRSLHAELIEKISKAQPRVIGLDISLSQAEQEHPDSTPSGDLALEKALLLSRTVLPVVTANPATGTTASQPIPALANAAFALGHNSLEHDGDGVVRSVFLHEFQNGKWWPHFALAMLDPELRRMRSQPPDASQSPSGLRRAAQMHIPFTGSNGHFRTVSYVSVLRGEVADHFFAGKYVLIGATASGMSDAFPTAVSGESGAMDGVEINANILASLLDDKSIALAHPIQAAWFSAAPVLLAMLCYFLLAPRASLIAACALLFAAVGASYLSLRAGLWLPPTAGLITLLISYPVWSWRRLEAAIDYLGQEFNRFDQEPHLLSEAQPSQNEGKIEDILERRINAMKEAARRVRDLRRFVSDILDNLPDASLVTNAAGLVLLENKHAGDYFASIGIPALGGKSLPELLSGLKSPQPIDQTIHARFTWTDLLDSEKSATLRSGVGARDQHGRDLLIKSAPCHAANNELSGWVVSIVDISTIRATERRRDETLRFLSHDMRSPQASILALLELQSDPVSALPLPEFYSRIEKATRKTLGLADNFVQLARAESQEYRLEEVDFQDILFDASDEMWTRAKSKNIKLSTDIVPGEYPVWADRALMTRSLVNLLSNAIDYSPENTRIVCTLHPHSPCSTHFVCSISDQGYGIEEHDQRKLFQRFQRVDHPTQPRHDGIGLGLVFVKTVIERHHGHITFSSKAGVGTTFTLTVPGIDAHAGPPLLMP